jgi:signal transduction histidine kinase
MFVAGLVVLSAALFGLSIPAYFTQLQVPCTGAGCLDQQLSPPGVRNLVAAGLSARMYSGWMLALATLLAGCSFLMAGAIIRRGADRMALYAAAMLALFGLVAAEAPRALIRVDPAYSLPLSLLAVLAFASVIIFINTFPTGGFSPGWIRWSTSVWLLAAVQGVLRPDVLPGALNAAAFLVAAVAGVAGLTYRYRHVANRVQREQVKWVVYGLSATLLGMIALTLLTAALPPLGPPSALNAIIIQPLLILVSLPIPVSLGVAILRYRLWDIDIVINRTLVYGGLSVSITGIYVLIVAGLATLLQGRGYLIISPVAAALVAVLFAPLRDRLQRWANRLMYGYRDDPYQVLTRLGQTLQATVAPDAVLATIARAVQDALRLPFATVVLEGGAAPTWQGETVRLPLVHRGERVGQLILAHRAGEDGFSEADLGLLEGLARQASIAVHAALLREEALRLSRDLQHSRERLVTAREEERRRLRRDLHDGLGPALASQTLSIDTARKLLHTSPEAADKLLAQLSEHTKAAVDDVRRLVYALRPPALDELGLVGALREQAATYEQGSGVRVDVQAGDLPALPAAVEVAAYRIGQEALTNVIRHSGASRCELTLGVEREDGQSVLVLGIADDGRGLAAGSIQGVGLGSMRERAGELGGICEALNQPGGGLRVLARLPIQER